MRILITGICGFTGSELALGLRRRDGQVEVSGIDSLVRPGSETSLARLRRAGIGVRHGDVRCASDFEALPASDWVVDAAANPSVLAGIDGRTSTRQLIEHNLLGTVNVLEFCRQHGAGLVLLSTSRVYSIAMMAALPLAVRDDAFAPGEGSWPPGASPQGITEAFSTAAPVSLYGATKLASEALALEYHDAFGIPVVINRCGVLAGPGQFGTAEQGIFSYWIRSWASARTLRYLGFGGTGHQVRDALHPADLLDLVQRQIERGASASGIWNVGGGPANAMSLAQLSRWCAGEFGDRPVERAALERKWDVPWMVLDSRRARAEFDWQPVVPLVEILHQIAEHHRQHPEWLDLSQPHG
jgi:CDP-paratose 2-epimerase